MRSRALRRLFAVSVSVLGSSAIALVAGGSAGASPPDQVGASIGGPAFTTVLQTKLTGASEVDANGTPDQGAPLPAGGIASLVIEQPSGALGHPETGTDICVRIIVSGIDTPTGAHIHKAAASANGAVVVTLPTPTDGTSQACVGTAAALMEDIIANPTSYYVNVHTAAYPNGAVRGQLASGTFPSPMTASLSGANEIGPAARFQGDPDGVGQASVLVDASGYVCAAVTVSGVEGINAGHIHSGAFTANGPVVVPFTTVPVSGAATTCENVTTTLASQIITTPSDYYVNLHSGSFPNGAVRGQLTYGNTSQHAMGHVGGVYRFGDAASLATTTELSAVGNAVTPSGKGQWLVTATGEMAAFGDAVLYGAPSGLPLNKPIVGIAAVPTGQGYWDVASDGGVFSYGDAQFYGSTGSITLNKPIVGMASTPTGRGYWLVASDGGVFAYGDAQFYGSTGSLTVVSPVVAMAVTPTGQGYYLVAGDGGVFAFGDARFAGSPAGMLPTGDPAIGLSVLPVGNGYRVLSASGVENAYGDAPALGSVPRAALPLSSPIGSYTK
ncbi:MAG: CHRD domain-containing protein [Acidimicrobiia bacterium]